MERSVEQLSCADYLGRSRDEASFLPWFKTAVSDAALIVAEGFEERSVGVLEACSENGIRLSRVVIGRYDDAPDSPNAKYRARFEEAARKVSQQPREVVENENDGMWVRAALDFLDASKVILDITGISNRGLFTALDIAAASNREVFIAYSEPGEYWPKENDWELLKTQLTGPHSLADILDEKPWLWGPGHKVELIPKHEGYDSAGTDRALVAFLPFKRARLAAVLGEEDYAKCVFVAGKPRLATNSWRFDALKTINQELSKSWHVVDMDTFGYRKALEGLGSLLLTDGSLLCTHDVHLAILGSKLQTVACWVLSCLVPAVTIVTSVPTHYFAEAFSEDIGAKWIFPLTPPTR